MLLKQDISTYGEIEYTHTHTKATLKIQKTIPQKKKNNKIK